MTWSESVRDAASGKELLDFLEKRLTNPYEEGPHLDDRGGEGPEEVFERLAKGDDAFRDRLEETIAGYFRSPAADPTNADAQGILRGMLEIVARLALAGAGSALRGWLARHEAALQDEPAAELGRAALDALAMAPIAGSESIRDFWLGWWRDGESSWQPAAFIGLRLQEPSAAANEIPLLVSRAEEGPYGPGPLLLGMWNQAAGQIALLDWLKKTKDAATADKVRNALVTLLPPEEHDRLRKPKPKRPLRPLASSRPDQWASL